MHSSLPQVLSYKMERVSLFPSVHVFTMVHHMYKDMCFNKDVVFGERGPVITSEHML